MDLSTSFIDIHIIAMVTVTSNGNRDRVPPCLPIDARYCY